jgi:hypothetical protein
MLDDLRLKYTRTGWVVLLDFVRYMRSLSNGRVRCSVYGITGKEWEEYLDAH